MEEVALAESVSWCSLRMSLINSRRLERVSLLFLRRWMLLRSEDSECFSFIVPDFHAKSSRAAAWTERWSRFLCFLLFVQQRHSDWEENNQFFRFIQQTTATNRITTTTTTEMITIRAIVVVHPNHYVSSDLRTIYPRVRCIHSHDPNPIIYV